MSRPLKDNDLDYPTPIDQIHRRKDQRLTIVIVVIMALLIGGLLLAENADAAEASCYGPGLYGNPMANGQTLTPSTVAVAHKTLPLNTTHLMVAYGSRAVRVTVKDRGPFVSGRDLDLTSAAVGVLGYGSCAEWGSKRVRTWRA